MQASLFNELNKKAASLNYELSCGLKSINDVEVNSFFKIIRSEPYEKGLEKVLKRYGILTCFRRASSIAKHSDEDKMLSFLAGKKIRPVDVYLSEAFKLDPSRRYYQLIKFIMNFSPYYELLLISAHIDKGI